MPAGSGTLTIWWCEIAGAYPSNFDVWFDDGTSYTSQTVTGTGWKTVLKWETDTAQTMTFESSAEGTGVWGMAVSVVPEPGTVALLASSLIGLIAHAWRRRK